jgi:hypothetical protein
VPFAPRISGANSTGPRHSAINPFIYGIDFGTSNSSITIWDAGSRRLVRDPRIAGVESSFMYFPYTLRRDPPLIGDAAKTRYVEDRMRGRFFQAIKTILPNKTFTETIVNNQPFTLEDLIAFFLRHLKAKADAVTGHDVKRVVMGRPAVFSSDPEEDALAQERLLTAARIAGFEEIHFQLEPIAAAFAYESRISGPETVSRAWARVLSDRPGVACQSCARPPSTATSLAVMKLLSDDARKAAAAAISAGSAMRWSGVIAA